MKFSQLPVSIGTSIGTLLTIEVPITLDQQTGMAAATGVIIEQEIVQSGMLFANVFDQHT